MPVVVDLSARLEAEQELVAVRLILHIAVLCGLDAVALVGVLHLAVPLHLIGIALEVRDADAEVVELVGELSSELVDEGLVLCGNIRLRHGLGDHLCHLIARDVLVALERRVAVAVDDAVRCELGYSVVCPVICRNIGERIGRCERRGGSADDDCRRECGYESLLHDELLLTKRETILSEVRRYLTSFHVSLLSSEPLDSSQYSHLFAICQLIINDVSIRIYCIEN